MSKGGRSKGVTVSNSSVEAFELRRGPWTVEEDSLLIHYITSNGEGRWNALAKSAGLKRTGKSCRLRWLNYLKPDIKRGNLSPQEQLLILELHSKWGNRWSKIAQHLPGRTDNEIKNYWRTRVQKQAKQLKVDSNSKKFIDAIRSYWMPRLREKMEHASFSSTHTPSPSVSTKDKENPQILSPFPHQNQPLLAETNCKLNQTIFSDHQQQITSSLSNSNNFSSDSLKKISNQNSPDQSYGLSFEDECYHVGIFSQKGQVSGLGGDHEQDITFSAETDWFNDDVGDSLWNMDEQWHLRKTEELADPAANFSPFYYLRA